MSPRGAVAGAAALLTAAALCFLAFVAVLSSSFNAGPARGVYHCRRERRAFSALRLCVLCVGLLLVGGCSGKSTAIDRAETQLGHAERAGNSAQAYAESGMSALADLAGYVTEAGRPVYDVTVRAFQKMAVAQTAAAEATTKAQGELKLVREEDQKKTDRITELEGSFWSHRQKRIFWTLVGVLALATVLRIIGLANLGWVGTIASFGGTVLFGIASGGLSLIQSIFDNLWFRWRAKKSEEMGGSGAGVNDEETEGSVVA